MPTPVTAHGNSSEIHPIRVTPKLPHGLLQGPYRQFSHFTPPAPAAAGLGKHHNGRKALGILTDTWSQAHLCLGHAILLGLVRTVDVYNYRPLPFRGVLHRNVYLVPVCRVAKLKCTLQKTCLSQIATCQMVR